MPIDMGQGMMEIHHRHQRNARSTMMMIDLRKGLMENHQQASMETSIETLIASTGSG
jgi:hypothetical protein